MPHSGSLPPGSATAPLRSQHIAAAMALVVIVLAGLLAEHQTRRMHDQTARAEVLGQLSLLRARLEGGINGKIQLVRGLVANIAIAPDMDQPAFAALAGKLIDDNSQIVNLAAAPGLVITLLHPLEGNEAALGLDYRHHPEQRDAALRAAEERKLVLAGPVDLVQGGRGFIGRFPVFVTDETAEGGERFWGIVSAVIDVDALLRESGLYAADLGIEVAITGRDALGSRGGLFFGSHEVTMDDPVIADVTLPAGYWRMSARPTGGWSPQPENVWLLRGLIGVAGALILLPIFMTSRLMHERQRHIGELRDREMTMRRLSQRLDLALGASKVGVWELNLDTGDMIWDERMRELYDRQDLGHTCSLDDWLAVLHPDDRADALATFRKSVTDGTPYRTQFRVRGPDGAPRHIRTVGAIHDGPGLPRRMVGVNWDVTEDVQLNDDLRRAKTLSDARNAELETAKARIEHNSLHDSLTGLPNRRYLDNMIQMGGRHCRERSGRLALLQIDVDRFKQINDTLGHAAGDAMLVHVATLLRACTRPEDFIARIGGDEFVILCVLEDDAGGAAMCASSLAERIIDRLRQPVPFDGHSCRIGVSIGIAQTGDGDLDEGRLLVNADIALYRAKRNGRNRYQFFNRILESEIVATKRLADELLCAIERDEFVPHYQLQVDARTFEVIGAETLVRWRHPERGLLAPSDFLAVAEEMNVVAAIDRMMLERALLDIAAWKAEGIAIPKLSVNVSFRRLHDPELIGGLKDLRVPPGLLSFELVESIFLDEDDDTITATIDALIDLGIDIEIDDFGSGHASIISLLRLKPHRLKIDRELIKAVALSKAQQQLVGSIIEMGRSLGIEVLAEGVETFEQARILERLGCQALQGYAFGRPMSAAKLAAHITAQRWREAS